MNKQLSIGLKIFVGLLLLFIAICLRPIPRMNDHNGTEVTGILTSIYGQENTFDVSIKLKNDPHNYYINRGLQYGVDVEKIKHLALNDTVTICYSNHWTPLDLKGKNPHVYQLMIGGETVFDEEIIYKK